jgi:hypothetical protein
MAIRTSMRHEALPVRHGAFQARYCCVFRNKQLIVCLFIHFLAIPSIRSIDEGSGKPRRNRAAKAAIDKASINLLL